MFDRPLNRCHFKHLKNGLGVTFQEVEERKHDLKRKENQSKSMANVADIVLFKEKSKDKNKNLGRRLWDNFLFKIYSFEPKKNKNKAWNYQCSRSYKLVKWWKQCYNDLVSKGWKDPYINLNYKNNAACDAELFKMKNMDYDIACNRL